MYPIDCSLDQFQVESLLKNYFKKFKLTIKKINMAYDFHDHKEPLKQYALANRKKNIIKERIKRYNLKSQIEKEKNAQKQLEKLKEKIKELKFKLNKI